MRNVLGAFSPSYVFYFTEIIQLIVTSADIFCQVPDRTFLQLQVKHHTIPILKRRKLRPEGAQETRLGSSAATEGNWKRFWPPRLKEQNGNSGEDFLIHKITKAGRELCPDSLLLSSFVLQEKEPTSSNRTPPGGQPIGPKGRKDR